MNQVEHTHEKPSQWRSILKIIILAGLGLYFAYNIISGNVTNYINQELVWLSYVAAGLFLLLTGGAVYSWWQEHQHDHDCDDHSHHHHHHDHDHEHGNIPLWVLGITSFPLLLGVFVPSQPLGVEAINGNVSVSAVSVTTTDRFIPPKDRTILDWLRVFNRSNDLTEFNGQEASVIGFIYTEPSFAENQMMVVRFTVSCCVADSSAVGLPIILEDFDADVIKDGVWVNVEGQFELGEFEGESVPMLNVETITVVDQPANPYLNP